MKLKTTQFFIVTLIAVSALKAQAPPVAFTFRAVFQPGVSIGGHTLTDEAVIDSCALSDSGEVAFVIHWPDAVSGQEPAAVFTSRRLVAQAGDTTADGKLLVTIAKDSLATNGSQVAYAADFLNDSADAGKGLTHRGVFIENHLALTLDPRLTGPDLFTLTADGRIILRPLPSSSTPAPSATATAPSSKRPGGFGNIHFNVPNVAGRVLNNPKSPIGIDPKAQSQSGDQKTAPQAPSQPGPSTPAASAARATGACAMPHFPFRTEWDMGAQMVGPVTSQIFDPPVSGRVFDSPYYGHLTSPFRAVQFDAGCHPLVIAIGDTTARGRFEIYTPLGTLTYRNPDGTYQFKGFSGDVESASFVKSDAMLCINRNGQVLIPVTLTPKGYALLIGTPKLH